MRFLALSALVLLSSWPLESAPAAEVRCASGIYGRYSLPQDEGWFRRRWPSGVRPTGSTCSSGFIFGPIKPGDYEKVRALYRQNHPFLASFILASSGGDVVEAISRPYLTSESAKADGASAPAHARLCGLVRSIVAARLAYTGHEPMIRTLGRWDQQKERTPIVGR